MQDKSEIKLSPDAFKQLRSLIYERCGIYFQDNKAYLLEGRVGQRLKDKGYKSFDDYIMALRYGADDELLFLFNAITINETSFFRDREQLEVISNRMLNDLVEAKKRKGSKRLKIWSAASSSGEEPYTMAIYLLEKHALLAGWDIEIVGSDISEAVLAAARKGAYGNYAVKNAPEHYLMKYFSSNGDGIHLVKPEVKQLVRFANANLYDSQRLKLMREMDIIMCRNVLIYFDDNSKRKVLSNLYDSLNPGGYLAIGRSESLHNLTRAFRPVNKDGMVFYEKI